MDQQGVLARALLSLATGCTRTYAELSARGATVERLSQSPASGCLSVGQLLGTSAGGPALARPPVLIEYATYDVLNQAAALGATHVIMQSPALGVVGGRTTSATTVAEASRCLAVRG